MAKTRVFSSDISVKGLRKLKKEIVNYRHKIISDSLHDAVDTMSNISKKTIRKRLDATEEDIGNYVDVQVYPQVFSKYNYRYKSEIVASNSKQNVKEWVTKDGTKSAEVNSILMAEYGSGEGAEKTGHRGTFPKQKHAFDKEWHWKRPDGTLGQSSGIKATRPMLTAKKELEAIYAREVEQAFSRH